MSSLGDRFDALRDAGYDSFGAGVELRLSVHQQAALERNYRKRRAGTAPSAPMPPPPIAGVDEGGYFHHRDTDHVGACKRLGGFPRAVTTEYQGRLIAVWVQPDGRLWRAA